MKNRFILFASVALCAGALSARAALVFEQKEIELSPSITDETAVAHFKYKNTGDKPVTITSVKPSCGCTTAEPPKDPIAPGGTGEIAATFHIGERTGLQTKTVSVMTDQPNEQTTVLTFRAKVPTLLEMKPMFLYWSRTQPLDTRTIEVKVSGDLPVTQLKVTSTDPDIKVETQPVPNEKAFQIKVTPMTANRPTNAQLRIIPDFPKDKPKTFSALVRVDAHLQEPPVASAAATP